MSTIYLIRHGQSDGNTFGGFAGHTDFPLSEKGRKQVVLTAEFLHGEHIEKVISSPLSRTMETARPVAEDRGLDILTDSELIEMNFGEWEALPYAELLKKFPDAISTWKNSLYETVCQGGESFKECYKRSLAAFYRIAEENEGHDICIVSHGAVIKCILCSLHGLEPKNVDKAPWVNNASVTKINVSDGKYEIVYEGESTYMGDLQTGILKSLDQSAK